jgi:hypothetical protein
MNIQYVYLIQTEEFVKSGEPVYKIGKSKQLNYMRFKQYDAGSIQLYQSICKNCDDMEKKIIQLFNSKYERHSGREYFKGNYDDMLQDISGLVETERLISGLVSDIVGDIIENIVDIVAEKVVNIKNDDTDSKNCEIDATDDEVDDNDDEVDGDEIDKNDGIVAPTNRIITTTGNTNTKKKNKFRCDDCDMDFTKNAYLQKHITSNKHKLKCTPNEPDINCKFQCKNCFNKYKGLSGLWHHSKKCLPKPVDVIVEDDNTIDTSDFEKIINELKKHIDHTNLSSNDLFALEIKKLNERFDEFIK